MVTAEMLPHPMAAWPQGGREVIACPTRSGAAIFAEPGPGKGGRGGIQSGDDPRARPSRRPGEEPELTRDALRAARLFALFLFGVIAFNYPLLEVFSARRTLFGVPLLYCWIFGAWLALIAVLARLGRRG